MAQYEDGQIEFAILGLVREPLIGLAVSLAENIRTLQMVVEHLDTIDSKWRDFITVEANVSEATAENLLVGPDAAYHVDQRSLDSVQIDSQAQSKLLSNSINILVPYWQEMVQSQMMLKVLIKEEQEAMQSDEEKAAQRRHDYGNAIHTWLQCHSQKSLVQEIVNSA